MSKKATAGLTENPRRTATFTADPVERPQNRAKDKGQGFVDMDRS